MKGSIKVISLVVWILFASCSREADFTAPTGYPNSPEGNFDAFWNGIDQNYVFFVHSTVDWDAVYRQYRGRVSSSTTNTELKRILESMFDVLIDGHRVITFDTSESYSGRNLDGPTFRLNIAQNSASRYLTNAFTLKGQLPGSNAVSDEILLGTIKNTSFGYINQRYFGSALEDPAQRSTLQQFIGRYASSGIILDMRNNTGGQATAFYNLVAQFINGSYQWGYSRFRLSRNRYDMSPYLSETINGSLSTAFTAPIIILVNKNSASAAELTTIALKGRSNVYVMGETTFGATGPLSEFVRYTGNFYLPNGWKVTLAQRISYDLGKNQYENTGITPNQIVVQDVDAFTNSQSDNVLDAAITRLNN